MKNTSMRLHLSAIADCDFADDAPAGSCGELSNMRGHGTSLRPVGKLTELLHLDGEERIIAVHHIADGTANVITLRGRNVMLHSRLDAYSTPSPLGTLLGTLPGDFMCATTLADYVVLGNSGGDVYLHHSSGTYHWLDVDKSLPVLRLTTEGAGTLSANVPAYNFSGYYTRWASPLNDSDQRGISAAMHSAFATIEENATSIGAYVNPVVARYAVRMTDGTYLRVSQPVLMGNGIPCSQEYKATVTNNGTTFTGTTGFSIYAGAYTIGAKSMAGFDAAWDGLIAGIDILVADGISPIPPLLGVKYRCETSTTGTRQEYLSLQFRTSDADSLVGGLLAAAKWKVVAVITDFAALRAGTASLRKVCHPIDASVLGSCESMMAARRSTTAATAHNRRVFATAEWSTLRSAWSTEAILNVDSSNVAHEAMTVTHIATPAGKAVSVWRGSGKGRPVSINALIAFPDSRAVSTTVYVSCEGAVRSFTAVLNRAAGIAYAVTSDLQPIIPSTTTSSALPSVTDSYTAERCTGTVTESVELNPLVARYIHKVCESRIIALGATAHRSNNVIGTPTYAFAESGVYALPYRTATAAYSPAVIVARKRIAGRYALADSDSRLCFATIDGDLCAIDRYQVECKARNIGEATHLAYCDKRRELWVTRADGSVVIVDRHWRRYSRSESIAYTVPSAQPVLAATLGGSVYAIGDETPSHTRISLLTQPMAPSGAEWFVPEAVTIGIAADNCDILVTILGENGQSCHGATLCSLHIHGAVGAPVTARIFAPPVRKVRISIAGDISADTVIGKISLKCRVSEE